MTDRQAADAVRSRIDWKYALGLALTGDGFDYSVLSKFRARLLAGEAEQLLPVVLVTRVPVGFLAPLVTGREQSGTGDEGAPR